jgi:hypothetical protein
MTAGLGGGRDTLRVRLKLWIVWKGSSAGEATDRRFVRVRIAPRWPENAFGSAASAPAYWPQTARSRAARPQNRL